MPEFVWELPPSGGSASSAPVSVESTDGVIDHAQAAVDRLPQQFKGKPKLEALIRILCAPMVALEQAFVDLLTKRTVETAEGVQLEVLARIVGQPIVDVSETTLRSLIRARIRANKSSGFGDQVLLVARLVLTDFAADPVVLAAGTLALEIEPQYPASFVLRVENVDLPWDLADLLSRSFLRLVKADGVRAILEFAPQDELASVDHHDTSFRFDGDADGGGFGDVSDPTVGGHLGAAIDSNS